MLWINTEHQACPMSLSAGSNLRVKLPWTSWRTTFTSKIVDIWPQRTSLENMYACAEGGRERERERKWMWEENFRKSSIEQHAVQKLVTCVFKRGRGKGIESSISLLILTFYLHYLHCLPNQITFRVVKTMWSRRNTVPLWCHFGDKNNTSHQVRKAFRSTTLRQTGDKAWRTCAELHRISSKHSVFSCWKPFQTLPSLVFDLVISDQCVFVCSCVFI